MTILRSILGKCATALAFMAGIAVAPAMAEIEKRVALVIGNGAYRSTQALENPVIDAKAVAAALKRLGFTVVEGYDLGGVDMVNKLSEFSEAIVDSKAAMVYYAGHGVSMDEENYLIPVDLGIRSAPDLELKAIGLSKVLRQMKREERVNIVVLDACRDNPFAADLQRGARSRSAVAERGLARVESDLAKGTLIAFATDPKSTALDGRPGENSPFTKALLRHIEEPGLSIDTVMNRVRSEVWEATKQKQMPWVNTSIIGEFHFNPVATPLQQVAALPDSRSPSSAGPPAASAAADRLAQENRMWESAERGNSADDYKAYLDAYPAGVYAQMARARIARLTGGASPAVVAARNPAATDTETPKSAVSPAALKAEVGTMQTEKAMNLDRKARQEIQQRLKLMEFNPGDTSGNFNGKTRQAIAEWQKSREVQPTTWLGPVQRAALLEQSEAAWQRQLNAGSMAPTRALGPAPRAPRVAPGVAAAQAQRRQAQQNNNRPVRGNGASGNGNAIGAFIGGAIVGGALGGLLRGR